MNEDLNPFLEAMQTEYMRHYPRKGDSWKNETAYFDCGLTVPMKNWLGGLLQSILQRYRESLNPDELVDLANIAAMIWIRTCKETVKEDG